LLQWDHQLWLPLILEPDLPRTLLVAHTNEGPPILWRRGTRPLATHVLHQPQKALLHVNHPRN